LENHEKRNSFKAYTSDTGLLVRQYGKEVSKAVLTADPEYNMGPVFENAVAECLTKAGFVPRWYHKSGGDDRMELDFVISLGGEAAVLEFKSGKDKSTISLSKVRDVFGIEKRMIFRRGTSARISREYVITPFSLPRSSMNWMNDFDHPTSV